MLSQTFPTLSAEYQKHDIASGTSLLAGLGVNGLMEVSQSRCSIVKNKFQLCEISMLYNEGDKTNIYNSVA